MIKLNAPEDTEALGLRIAKAAQPGEVYALVGDLGAGKTTLVQAVAKGLGIKSKINSPTFTIVQEYYEGRLPLFHFDVYRVSAEEDLFELGFEEYLHGNGICFIEWADLVKELLPEDTCVIYLEHGASDNERFCRIEAPLGFDALFNVLAEGDSVNEMSNNKMPGSGGGMEAAASPEEER